MMNYLILPQILSEAVNTTKREHVIGFKNTIGILIKRDSMEDGWDGAHVSLQHGNNESKY